MGMQAQESGDSHMTVIDVQGMGPVNIINFDEFSNALMNRIGNDIKNAVVDQVDALGLVDTGRFISSIDFTVEDGTLTVFSDAPYAAALEFGTMDFGAQFSEDTFPNRPVKKKNLSETRARNLPRGMNPFAPFRRVFFNERLMQNIISKGSAGVVAAGIGGGSATGKKAKAVKFNVQRRQIKKRKFGGRRGPGIGSVRAKARRANTAADRV